MSVNSTAVNVWHLLSCCLVRFLLKIICMSYTQLVLLSGLGSALRPASFLPLVSSLFIVIFLQLEHAVPFQSNGRCQGRQHITVLFAPPPNHLFRMEMLAEDDLSESRINETRRKNYASFWLSV